jgi:predicted negative regulator of RcsB-dependent stress response
VDTYTPDDQVAQLKAWWKQYGKSLIAGVLIGALLLAGLTYWKQYRAKRAESASLLYEGLLADFQQGKGEAIAAGATTLMQDYDGTPYAGKAAQLLARQRFDAKDATGAREPLEWAMKNAREPGVEHSARLRLVRLQLEAGELDAALALLAVKDMEGFESEYQELKGDVLLAKGDRDGARAAYQAALDKLARGSGYGRPLAMKRENLGPGPKP